MLAQVSNEQEDHLPCKMKQDDKSFSNEPHLSSPVNPHAALQQPTPVKTPPYTNN